MVSFPEGDHLETPGFFCSGFIYVKIQQTKLLILVFTCPELTHREERVPDPSLTIYMAPGTHEVSFFIMSEYPCA